jgi:twitching motility protein PilT
VKLSVFEKILKTSVTIKASDIHFKINQHPIIRLHGRLATIQEVEKIKKSDLDQIASLILRKEDLESFNSSDTKELETSFTYKEISRFRVSIFREVVGLRIIMRIISNVVPSFEELRLPKIVSELATFERGLILVTGATGSGKSTTLASMIDWINMNQKKHIITVEDPIEFEIPEKKSIITQREIGMHCNSFSKALRSSLRQDPNVIMIGEIRDYETIMSAITAAETGHLILSTLHTIDATESINRMLGLIPKEYLAQIRHQIASVLLGVISLRLIPKADGRGRVPAVEVLVNNPRVKELIENIDRTKEIKDVIEESGVSFGMQSFDQSIIKLLLDNLITPEDALRYCTNPNNFKMKLKGINKAKSGLLKDVDEKRLDSFINDSEISSIVMENE